MSEIAGMALDILDKAAGAIAQARAALDKLKGYEAVRIAIAGEMETLGSALSAIAERVDAIVLGLKKAVDEMAPHIVEVQRVGSLFEQGAGVPNGYEIALAELNLLAPEMVEGTGSAQVIESAADGLDQAASKVNRAKARAFESASGCRGAGSQLIDDLAKISETRVLLGGVAALLRGLSVQAYGVAAEAGALGTLTGLVDGTLASLEGAEDAGGRGQSLVETFLGEFQSGGGYY